jgi:ribonucleoside-diphosphate reductase beta chain
MTKTVFNKQKIDYLKQPMFFGEDGGVQRYDEFKYPQFDKLNQTMIGYFWRPEEVSLQKDRADYQSFRPEQKHIELEISNTVGFSAGQRTKSYVLAICF